MSVNSKSSTSKPRSSGASEGPALVLGDGSRDWTVLASELELVRKAIAEHPSSQDEAKALVDRAQELESALLLHDVCLADATAALSEIAGLLARVAVQHYGAVASDEDTPSERHL